jgi:hypothetical protein
MNLRTCRRTLVITQGSRQALLLPAAVGSRTDESGGARQSEL